MSDSSRMESTRPIRVLLADDHRVLREGLASLLDARSNIELVGEASNGFDACRAALDIGPDVVVLDVGLPELNGVEVCRRITAERPDIRVLMLTMHDDAATVDRALRAGARGYVLKGTGADALCEGIAAVNAGRVYLDPAVSSLVVHGYLHGGDGHADPLTAREREVVQLVAEGFTSREIGERLGVQTKTVQNYRSIVMDKLGVRTTAGLVRYALRVGLTSG